MHMKSIVSAGALAIALGLVGPAFAQEAATTTPTMIGNQQLSEADAERVKVYCEDLDTESNQAVGATGAEGEANQDATADSDSDTAALGSVDLSIVTIENCAEAGFIEGPVTP
jgi:hypothetical protein